MKSRQLTGKTIKKVEQRLWESNIGATWVLHRILFTDGSALMFNVAEGEGEYGVLGVYPACTTDEEIAATRALEKPTHAAETADGEPMVLINGRWIRK